TKVKLELKKQENESLKTELKSSQKAQISENLLLKKQLRDSRVSETNLRHSLLLRDISIRSLQKENLEINRICQNLEKDPLKISPINFDDSSNGNKLIRNFGKSVFREASLKAQIKNLEREIEFKNFSEHDEASKRQSENYFDDKNSKKVLNRDNEKTSKNVQSDNEKSAKIQIDENKKNDGLSAKKSMKDNLFRIKSDMTTELLSENQLSMKRLSLYSKTFDKEKSSSVNDLPNELKNVEDEIVLATFEKKKVSESLKIVEKSDYSERSKVFKAFSSSSSDVFAVLEKSSEEDIAANMLLIVQSIKDTPLWLHRERKRILSIVRD
ncbi:hypothetical protein MHBO_003379, partial [Bonamia ostreae]